jgi:hypothetical protein
MKIITKAGERLPQWLATEIRPVLAFTGAGRALVTGSRILTRRGWDALSERLYGWEKYGALAFTGYAAVYTGGHAPHIARFVIPAAAVVWCVAAWWVAPPVVQPAVEDTEPEPDEQPGASDPQGVYEATLEWIWQQIGDAQGVHLRDLLAHAHAHGMFEDLEVTDLKGHLERWAIPIRKRCRVRGLGVTVGIHRDDLPAPSRPSPGREAQDPPESELHAG